ncbi:Meteorin-like protein [Galemys pyrenaicus]|uniref:Meteorin-like protein n=1 Tax=Galemys pyrenaicus TaxID=202257 RepID=A0A8J5ZWT9_GALPY|nr:Meteorin-like protein [Galemys pyrenaicus]
MASVRAEWPLGYGAGALYQEPRAELASRGPGTVPAVVLGPSSREEGSAWGPEPAWLGLRGIGFRLRVAGDRAELTVHGPGAVPAADADSQLQSSVAAGAELHAVQAPRAAQALSARAPRLRQRWAGGRAEPARGARGDRLDAELGPPAAQGECLLGARGRGRRPSPSRSRSMRGAARTAGGRAGQLRPRRPAPGPGPPPPLPLPLPPPPPLLLLLLLLLLAELLGGAGAQYSSDLCSWKGRLPLVQGGGPELQGRLVGAWPRGWGMASRGGACTPADRPCPSRSGLTHEAHRKEVEQVYLRCAAGAVEWMYPTGALIVNLRPNTLSPRPLTLCIKPLQDASGANIYLEKTGELKLLVRDGERGPSQARCFPFEQGGLFVEATPQLDISRRATGFQYELTGHRAGSHLLAPSAPCRPCTDTEVLLAVCTSDFVVRGAIQDVTHEPERQASTIHLRVSRVYRQKSRVFRPAPGGGWRGRVSTLLQCGVRPGPGEFLFTGHLHFGEAQLGCAPRFQAFQSAYRDAEERALSPCQLGAEDAPWAPEPAARTL